MCCTMSSCCWSAWSDCSLIVTFSLGCALFHLATVGAQTPELSLPVTNVMGPLDWPPPEPLPLPQAASVVEARARAATPARTRPLFSILAIRLVPFHLVEVNLDASLTM